MLACSHLIKKLRFLLAKTFNHIKRPVERTLTKNGACIPLIFLFMFFKHPILNQQNQYNETQRVILF